MTLMGRTGDKIDIVEIDNESSGTTYSNYFSTKCHPNLSSALEVIESVRDKCISHLNRQSLGSLLLPNLTVKAIVDQITSNQGCFIEGDARVAFNSMTKKVLLLGSD